MILESAMIQESRQRKYGLTRAAIKTIGGWAERNLKGAVHSTSGGVAHLKRYYTVKEGDPFTVGALWAVLHSLPGEGFKYAVNLRLSKRKQTLYDTRSSKECRQRRQKMMPLVRQFNKPTAQNANIPIKKQYKEYQNG